MKTLFKNKSSIIIGLVALGTAFISSCKKDEPVTPVVYGDAKVRVVNAIPGSNSQDFYQNETAVTGGTVAYGAASAYLTIKAGPSTLGFKTTGTTTTTASSSVGTETNGTYTVFYVNGSNGNGTIAGYVDDNTPVTGKAKIRFIHLGSAFNNDVNVSLKTGTAIATGLRYGQASFYQNIDANADINLTVIGSVPVTISGSNFVAGKVYTVWFDATNNITPNYHIIAYN